MARAVTAAAMLVRLLRDPTQAEAVAEGAWTDVLTAARAERLLPALAHRLDSRVLPPRAATLLAAARADAETGRVQALWEAEMARRALALLEVPVVLLKGTAYLAAGLAAGVGRLVGDLDMLVPYAALREVEQALRGAGWEAVKHEPYDDAYYRRWMHELPPLIHRERDRMVDVHHDILPPTAGRRTDPARLIADARPLEGGLAVLAPPAMVVHAAAHLIADGDLEGGLRNLWDIDRLVREFGERDPEFPAALLEEAARHDLSLPVARALGLAHRLFGTPGVGEGGAGGWERLAAARMLARDGWGRPTRKVLRGGFYLRSHLIRMPLRLLVPHLLRKATARRG